MGLDTKTWADDVVETRMLKRKRSEYVCEGMWTPSGYFHIGNARPEIFTPYAVRHALELRGEKVKQNLVIDDFDAVRKIPDNPPIPKEDFDKYLGIPCAIAPSPLEGYKTWSDAFSSDVREAIEEYGVKLNIMSAYDVYKEGKLNDLIIESIEKASEIVKVWNRIAGTQKDEKFIPLQVLCQECKRIFFTESLEWNGKEVNYKCNKCEHTGWISPLNGNAKLHWRVHWAAFWVLNKVDFESAGKDHFSKGGSVDVGQAFMKEIFKVDAPVQIPTEFIQLKGEKMSGSIGNVIGLSEWLKIASPESYRFLNFSYRPNKVIELSFKDNSFVLLMERFEHAKKVFLGLDKAQSEKLTKKISRDYELSIINKNANGLMIPFTSGIQASQLFDIENDFENTITKLKEEKLLEDLNNEEKKELKKQLTRTKNWIEKYAPDEVKITLLENPKLERLENTEREAINSILETMPRSTEVLTQVIFNEAKKREIKPKRMFQLFYTALFGKNFGPKLDTIELAFGKEKIISQIKKSL